MAKTKQEAPQTDEWAGIGGRYIADPATGKRAPAPAEQDHDQPTPPADGGATQKE